MTPRSGPGKAGVGVNGVRPKASPAASASKPRQLAAAAQITVRRSVESAASSGTTTIHGMRKDAMPPVSQAVQTMRPAKLVAEMRCAAPNRPVREVIGPESVQSRRRAVVGIQQRQHAWAESFEIRERLVETVLVDHRRIADISLPTQMPFAEMAGGIASTLEGTREHGCLGIEPLRHAAFFVRLAVVEE